MLYGNQSLTNATAWANNVHWTSVATSTTIGSGFTIDGYKIKVNDDNIKKIKVTASVVSYRANKQSDVYFLMTFVRTAGNYTRNIFYQVVNSYLANTYLAGGSLEFFIDVAKNDTVQMSFGTGVANTTVDHMGITLTAEDVTEY